MSYPSYTNYLGAQRLCNLNISCTQGSQGAQGAQGDIGPIGPIGLQGATGPIIGINSTSDEGATGLVLYNSSSNTFYYNTTGKTFVIDHPLNHLEQDKTKEKYLVHACLEGPEVGVYYRGKGEITNNKFTIIQLPDYVSSLAYNFTIQLTSIYDDDLIDDLSERNYKAGKVIDNSFKVYGRKNGAFYWTVYGERAIIDIEPLKNSTHVKGTGPYTWI